MNTHLPSQRQLRVSEQLRHIMAETLQRGSFNNPLLFEKASQITVAEVRVSPDMKHATAYISMLAVDDIAPVLKVLNESAHIFQHDINGKMKMKFTPKVKFVIDDRFDKAGRIEDILRNLPKSAEE